MHNLKKFTLGAATVLAALAPVAGVAAAGSEASPSTAEPTRLVLAVDEKPTLQADGSVVVTGTVRCPEGSFLLTASLRQGTEFQGNFTGGTCTGATQAWSLNVGGRDFRRGDALATATLQPSGDNFNEVQTSNTVRVR